VQVDAGGGLVDVRRWERLVAALGDA
jgi:hypothetical protein